MTEKIKNKGIFYKFKNWVFKVTHVKCDYCKEPVKQYYDAYIFPIKEYKGDRICTSCLKKLNSEEIIFC